MSDSPVVIPLAVVGGAAILGALAVAAAGGATVKGTAALDRAMREGYERQREALRERREQEQTRAIESCRQQLGARLSRLTEQAGPLMSDPSVREALSEVQAIVHDPESTAFRDHHMACDRLVDAIERAGHSASERVIRQLQEQADPIIGTPSIEEMNLYRVKLETLGQALALVAEQLPSEWGELEQAKARIESGLQSVSGIEAARGKRRQPLRRSTLTRLESLVEDLSQDVERIEETWCEEYVRQVNAQNIEASLLERARKVYGLTPECGAGIAAGSPLYLNHEGKAVRIRLKHNADGSQLELSIPDQGLDHTECKRIAADFIQRLGVLGIEAKIDGEVIANKKATGGKTDTRRRESTENTQTRTMEG